MPILFSRLCDLLSVLEDLHTRKRPLPAKVLQERCKRNIIKWFEDHRTLIDADDTDGVALLSSLLPARRSDRVYGLRSPSLTKILARCFGLVGTNRMRELERWKEPDKGDLGNCIERVLKATPNPVQSPVTIEQIDAVLDGVAARSRFSGPEIRAKKEQRDQTRVDTKLGSIYLRLEPNGAKWFTRMLLKDYGTVVLPEGLIFWCFNRLLPCILKVHDNFQVAVALLRGLDLSGIKMTPGVLTPAGARRQHNTIAKVLLPKCGVKIGRPLFLKAWSIEYALELAHGRKMSLERKYDGEYCQIHVDLGKPGNEIQIFSKSRKDSTKDRRGLHATILECLRIGEDECQVRQKCILEGELLVWSTKESKILPFDKIRKHIDRSGSFLGTVRDSPTHSWEQLMIVLFDVLLVDEDPVLHQPHRRRRERLAKLIAEIPGRAILAQCQEINFSSYKAAERLTASYADAIARRWEGLVLKPSDEPYVDFLPYTKGEHRSSWIKLKKDYIPGLGDTAEFAVVGAGYDASEAAKLGLTHLPWTVFHIGALVNKAKVLDQGAKPKFVVLDSFNTSIPKVDMERLCQLGKFCADPVGLPVKHELLAHFYQRPDLHRMNVVFTVPFVFEVKGSGFVKPPNCDYFLLRFPRLVKVHWDRSYKDTVSFDELQDLAREATREPEDDLLSEIADWEKRVRDSDKGRGRQGSRGEDSEGLESDSDAGSIPPSPTLMNRPINMKPPPEQTFIRMDTSEILPTEQRLDTGEVVSQPLSTHSTSTTESASTNSPPPALPSQQFPSAHSPNSTSTTASASTSLLPPTVSPQQVPSADTSSSTSSTESAGTSSLHPAMPPPQFPSADASSSTSSTESAGTSSLHPAMPPPQFPSADASSSTSSTESAGTSSLHPAMPPPQSPNAVPTSKVSSPSGRKRPRPENEELDRNLRPPKKIIRTYSRANPLKSALPALFLSPLLPRASLKEVANHAFPSPKPKTPCDPPKGSHRAHESSSLSLVRESPPRILVQSTKKFIQEHTSPSHNTSRSKRTRSRAASSTSKSYITLPISPEFAQSLTVLSPCVAQLSHLTENLLPSHDATVVSACELSASITTSHATAKQDVVVLVDSFRDGATARFLKVLLPSMGTKVKRVEIWDWRTVQQVKGVEQRLGKWFVGWIRRDVSGDWMFVWKNGDMTRVR